MNTRYSNRSNRTYDAIINDYKSITNDAILDKEKYLSTKRMLREEKKELDYLKSRTKDINENYQSYIKALHRSHGSASQYRGITPRDHKHKIEQQKKYIEDIDKLINEYEDYIKMKYKYTSIIQKTVKKIEKSIRNKIQKPKLHHMETVIEGGKRKKNKKFDLYF